MDRLHAEIDRLYAARGAPATAGAPAPLLDARGHTRAAVLEVVQPVGWEALSAVWQAVQAELELPAPAIAMSGVDAVQLWFALEQPVPAGRATAFLDALRARYLADVPAARVRAWPDAATPPRHAAPVPAPQAGTDHWSAFVSPDLAAVFSDTPWLDIEPGEEGQAALLRGLRPIPPAAFDAAIALLRPAAPAPAPIPEPVSASPEDDARRFLRRVMNDETVDLALRIEAAKGLLR